MSEDWSDLGNDGVSARYSWPPGDWIRLNLVVDASGQTVGPDATSNSLSSRNDRLLVRAIRADAEVLIVGASSVRAEGWHIPAHARVLVVSRSHDLPKDCPAPERVSTAHLEELGALAKGLKGRVLCEGGARVARTLLASDAVDEICLSFKTSDTRSAPVLPAWMTTETPWQCISDVHDATHRFTLWRRGIAAPSASLTTLGV